LFAIGLAEVLEMTLKTNTQIIAAEKNLESQSESINQMLAQKKPSISANIVSDRNWNLKNNDDVDSISAAITARYMLFDGNLTNHQIDAERHRIDALQSEFKGIEQRIIYDSVIAYLSVLRNQSLVQLSKKNVNVLNQQLDATVSRYQLGELTRTDVAQATAALESATSILASRQGLLDLAYSIFETAVGIPPTELDVNIELPPLPSTLEEAKNLAVDFNTTIKANLIKEKRSKSLLEAAKSNTLPTLSFSTSLSGGESASQSEFTNFGFSLTGSIPLYNGGLLKSKEKQALHELDLRIAQTEISRLNVMQAVVSAWSDFEVSSSIIIARAREVEATELAYQGTIEEARLGARTTLDVLNAEQTLMNTKTNLETARSDRLAAGYRLLLQMGTLTSSAFGEPG
jgi:outer membrane protein